MYNLFLTVGYRIQSVTHLFFRHLIWSSPSVISWTHPSTQSAIFSFNQSFSESSNHSIKCFHTYSCASASWTNHPISTSLQLNIFKLVPGQRDRKTVRQRQYRSYQTHIHTAFSTFFGGFNRNMRYYRGWLRNLRHFKRMVETPKKKHGMFTTYQLVDFATIHGIACLKRCLQRSQKMQQLRSISIWEALALAIALQRLLVELLVAAAEMVSSSAP